MASSMPLNPTAHSVAQLIPKLYEADADFRYMALNDLHQILDVGHPAFLSNDFNTCARTIDGLLRTLNDTNGEVQNMAVRCLEPFVKRVPENILCPMIEKISNLQTEKIVDNSIPALALRTIVISLPKPVPGIPRTKQVQEAYNAVSKALMPRLVGYTVIPTGRKDLPPPPKGMLTADMEKGTDSNAIDVLIEVARCFGPMLQEPEIHALQQITFELLENDRTSSVLKKKAVVAISALAPYFSDGLLSSFVSRLIESFRDVHLTYGKRKLYITILGSMARSIPRKFGPYLKTLAPFVLSALSEGELDDQMAEDEEERDPEADEVREAALVAVESFLASCAQDMRSYTSECIDAATRFLKYDPNFTGDDEEMEGDDDEADEFDDEDFEEEAAFDDEDDASWKVRRCAAKALLALISTRSNGDLLEDGTLYDRVAPALVARFKEREESVRLEVLAALSQLVRNTGGNISALNTTSHEGTGLGLMGPPPSRKRRRGGSDASMFDTQANISLSSGITSHQNGHAAPTGPQARLSKLSPEIIKEVSYLLKTSTLPTKQASISLLRDIVVAQHGGLSDYLPQIIDPVVEAVQTTNAHTGGSSAALVNSYRITALQFLNAVAAAHPTKVLQPYMSKIVPALINACQEKYSKVAVEALHTVEQFINVLTPPSTTTSDQQNQKLLEQLYDAITNRVSAKDADLEVRQQAIHVMGILLGRASAAQGLISSSKRTAGLDLLADRLRNQLTRLASVRSIETVAAFAQNKNEFAPEWVRTVALELGAQFRQASRSLRGASLSALRTIAVNPATRENLDSNTIKELVGLIDPLLSTEDLHLLGPALVILTAFVQSNAQIVVNQELIKNLCAVVRSPIGGHTLDALLALVKAVGEQGAGAPLMAAFLRDVGVGGSPEIVGKVIGCLLVAGQSNVGVKLDDFVTELNTVKDDKRQCLALAVLGEAALRMGSASPLQPQLFMQHFSSKSDKVPLTAAVALGRAAAGNMEAFLPVVLSTMSQPSSPQYLLLHSLREILQHDEARSEVLPHVQELWRNLITASQAEDNKAIGAECIGRLAILDPKTFLPQLQAFLSDKNPSVRGMVISALRYTLADTDEAYDEYLRPIVVGMLTTMLNETDLENRRLALTTLNSALHNKPDLILPCLDQLLPLAVKETVIRPELIREVQMGPFKHKVDDGLEIRKSAYETLYALLEFAFPRLTLSDLYDRIVAGLADEHDIRTLCNLMLSKLIHLAPDETQRHLEPIAEHFRAVLASKPKENAVKQEIERSMEAQRGVVKVSVALNKAFGEGGEGEGAGQRRWREYWEWVRKEFAGLVKGVEEEMREKER